MMFAIKRIEFYFNLISIILRDRLRLQNRISHNRIHLEAAIEWIKHAQDVTKDRGVSAGYFYGVGWRASFPEATGYIIPTMFDYYYFAHDNDCRNRALQMSDWLITEQSSDGSFHTGLIGESFKPEVFDTGQIMHGLIRSYKETKHEKYLISGVRAGDWLVKTQDLNGSWRKYSYNDVPHTYYTRVAYPLLELYEVTGDQKYKNAAIHNVEWALANCNDKGWFKNCSFRVGLDPLTHTIAYTVEGILESGLLLNDDSYVQTAIRTMNYLLKTYKKDGLVKATYDENWIGHDNYSCLVGDAQIAMILLKLYMITANPSYMDYGVKLNNFLKANQVTCESGQAIRGAIKGSYPIYGNYMLLAFPSWATKFFIDSLLLQEAIHA